MLPKMNPSIWFHDRYLQTTKKSMVCYC